MNSYIEKEKNFLSVNVNLDDKYNNDIAEFFSKVDKFLHQKFEVYEFIIINNNCSEETEKKLKKILSEIHANVTIINLPWKHTIEDVMKAGLDISVGDFVLEFDQPIIDFNIDFLTVMYEECLKGFDVVSAVPEHNIKLSSRLFYRLFNTVSYKNMNLTTENFRIVSRRVLNRILANEENFQYRKAAYHYSGFDTKIIKYNSKQRKKDSPLSEKINLAGNILTYHSNLGTKICALISLIFFILSIAGASYTILSYIFVQNIQRGWTTTMLFLSGSFTGLFFILTIISKYLEALIREIQNKPSYIYKSIDKISKLK